MRILVTGGAGFIGSHIVDALLAEGWDVRVLDSLDPSVHPRAPDFDARVDVRVGNVGDPMTIAAALDGVDVVSHQSAKVGLGQGIADAPDYVRDNDLATAVLLAAMGQAGVGKLVLASSMVVYGEGAYSDPATGRMVRPAPRRIEDLEAGIFDPRDPESGRVLVPGLISEEAALDPRNFYAATKLAQENLARSWSRAVQGTAIALRYHNVYGPRMPRDTPYAGVASLFRSATARGEAPMVFEDGAQRRSFIHVRDVAAANVIAAEALLRGTAPGGDAAPGGGFRAYNVGSDEVHTVGDVAAALSRHGGAPPPIVTGQFRAGDVRHITASSTRIGEELGWQPSVSFDDGMREFALAPLRGE